MLIGGGDFELQVEGVGAGAKREGCGLRGGQLRCGGHYPVCAGNETEELVSAFGVGCGTVPSARTGRDDRRAGDDGAGLVGDAACERRVLGEEWHRKEEKEGVQAHLLILQDPTEESLKVSGERAVPRDG